MEPTSWNDGKGTIASSYNSTSTGSSSIENNPNMINNISNNNESNHPAVIPKKIGIEDFSTFVVLGKGTFGKVILVKKKDTHRFYAMKVIKKSRLQKDAQIHKITVERSILSGIDHPFIMKLVYSFQTEEKLYFVIDYCPGGDLFHLVRKVGPFNEDLTKFYSVQVILAIEHLHSKNIIYRDLKPENAMIDFEGFVRLTDFGLSKEKIQGDTKAYSMCGTPAYIAPEILLGQGHTSSIDWWSLGAFMFELLTGIPPFYDQNQNQMFNAIVGNELVLPQHLSPACADLLSKLLTKNPENRLGKYGGAEVRAHPFFACIDWNILYQKQYRPPFVPSIETDFGLCNFSDKNKNLPVDSMTDSAKEATHINIEGFTFNHSQSKQIMDMQE